MSEIRFARQKSSCLETAGNLVIYFDHQGKKAMEKTGLPNVIPKIIQIKFSHLKLMTLIICLQKSPTIG